MRFKIRDKVYEASSVDRLSMGQLLRIEAETGAVGRPMKWPEVKALLEDVSELDADEVDNHPDAMLLLGLMVWASRLNAGEKVTLAEAVDFALGDLEWIAEPQDHKKAKDPTNPRPASGRGAKRAAPAGS